MVGVHIWNVQSVVVELVLDLMLVDELQKQTNNKGREQGDTDSQQDTYQLEASLTWRGSTFSISLNIGANWSFIDCAKDWRKDTSQKSWNDQSVDHGERLVNSSLIGFSEHLCIDHGGQESDNKSASEGNSWVSVQISWRAENNTTLS